MAKSPDAFRTIREVAEWLDTPAHVLRFWESRFTQVKPVKRAGGRRYYRPSDMELLGGIKQLLHEDGLTIRGVQKLLREQGVRHVADKSQPLDLVVEPCAMAGASQRPHTETQKSDRASARVVGGPDLPGISPSVGVGRIADDGSGEPVTPDIQDVEAMIVAADTRPLDRRGADRTASPTEAPPRARTTSAARVPYLAALRDRRAAGAMDGDKDDALAMARALLDRMDERD